MADVANEPGTPQQPELATGASETLQQSGLAAGVPEAPQQLESAADASETPQQSEPAASAALTPQRSEPAAGAPGTAQQSEPAAGAPGTPHEPAPAPQQEPPAPPPAAVAALQNDMQNIINVDLAANPFNNNRNRGGQNNLINVRDRLFHAIYFKVALMYAQIFPRPMQRALEYFILLKALLFFFALVYIHMMFIKNPATCLSHVKNWPRDGVLRVEVIPNLQKKLDLLANTQANEQLVRDLQNHYYYGIGPQTKDNYYRLKQYEQKLIRAGYQLRPTYGYANATLIYYFKTEAIAPTKAAAMAHKLAEKQLDNGDDDEQYIVEYSLEYGHLRLSPATRKRLHIPVRVVQLDPLTDKCFGDKFSKFLLKELLGYDDLLMASVRVIAEQEDNKGYLRNVITGEHYRFVSMWWAAWSSYPTAFFVMLLFTFSISMLLRFSHHQIFVFIVDLLQMLEFNVTARFPIAPLLTVILALVGMEAIMSEFFNDTTTAFYIILIVWFADQYDAVCCHTSITKRHWLRFFYLYHFAFYAYHYRFSGQNRSLALVSSWFFIQHSMFYFFHHYELPVIMQQAQLLIITRNQNAPNVGQDGRTAAAIFASRLFRRAPPPAAAAAAGAGAGAGAAPAGAPQQQQQQQAANAARNQHQIPLVGGLLQRHIGVGGANIGINIGGAGIVGGGALNTIRRALLTRGWMAPVRVRVQIGNLQRINLGTIQINPANLAATPPANGAAAHVASENVASGTEATNASATSSSGVAFTAATTTAATTLANNGNLSAAAEISTECTTAVGSSEGEPAVNSNHNSEHQNTTSANNSTGAPETVQNNRTENVATQQLPELEGAKEYSEQDMIQQRERNFEESNHKSVSENLNEDIATSEVARSVATGTAPAANREDVKVKVGDDDDDEKNKKPCSQLENDVSREPSGTKVSSVQEQEPPSLTGANRNSSGNSNSNSSTSTATGATMLAGQVAKLAAAAAESRREAAAQQQETISQAANENGHDNGKVDAVPCDVLTLTTITNSTKLPTTRELRTASTLDAAASSTTTAAAATALGMVSAARVQNENFDMIDGDKNLFNDKDSNSNSNSSHSAATSLDGATIVGTTTKSSGASNHLSGEVLQPAATATTTTTTTEPAETATTFSKF